jgi:DNA-binding CsgD family transcriptional regulator
MNFKRRIGLSQKQIEVMSMFGYGLTEGEISEALKLSPKTVQYHRTRINHVMKFTRFAEIVRTAIAFGMVSFCFTLMAAGQTAPITIVWNNPGPQYTNLVYNIYWQTNLAIPTNQWMKLATNIAPLAYGSNQLQFHTNVIPAQYFFTATAYDTFWHSESFFSQGAATPQPLTTPLLNLQVLPQ